MDNYKYDITINGAGILTKDINKTGFLILFEDTTEDVFKEFGSLHPKAELKEDIVIGDTFNIGGNEYKVIAIGETANKSLRETGHVSIHLDEDPDLDAPSVIVLNGPPFPVIEKGTRIFVK